MRSSDELARRDLIFRGAVGVGALASAAAVPGFLAEAAFAQEEASADSDLEILLGLIGYEQSSVVTYNELAPLLAGDAGVAKQFAAQEQEHLDALLAELAGIDGGEPPDPPRREDIAGLTEVKSREAAIKFAMGVETMAITSYFDALRSFENPALQKAAARIIGVEGQHLVVWRQTQGADPVPDPFPE